MMMTMIVFNKQQLISMVSDKQLQLSEYKSQVKLNNLSLARSEVCGYVCVVGNSKTTTAVKADYTALLSLRRC